MTVDVARSMQDGMKIDLCKVTFMSMMEEDNE